MPQRTNEEKAAYMREYRRNHPDPHRGKRYWDIIKKDPIKYQQYLDSKKLYRDKNRDEINRKSRIYNLKYEEKRKVIQEKFRLLSITHYSNRTMKCVCCGENIYDFLIIDHINGGGSKHVNQVHNLYKWLVKNNYPSGYQVLCFNCNCEREKSLDRVCPHKKIIKTVIKRKDLNNIVTYINSMVNYIISNSVSYLKRGDYEIFPNMLNLKFPPSYHSTLYTVMGALHQSFQLPLSKNDKTIFNVGINDCIFRKDKKVQLSILEPLLKESISNNDYLSIYLLKTKIKQVENKGENDLYQLLTFQEFENILDVVFSRLTTTGKTIVLSINWFSQANPYIGYAFNECVKTNEILKKSSNRHGFTYIDLWKPNQLTAYDGVHLNKEGHEHVTNLLKEVL